MSKKSSKMVNQSLYSGKHLRYSDQIINSVLNDQHVSTKKTGMSEDEWIDMLTFDNQDKVKFIEAGVPVGTQNKRKHVGLKPAPLYTSNSCDAVVHSSTTTKRRRGRPRKKPVVPVVDTSMKIPVPEPYKYDPNAVERTTDEDLELFLDLFNNDDEVGDQVKLEHGSQAVERVPDAYVKKSGDEKNSDCKDGHDWDFAEENRKRSKWTEEELLRLWQGIAKHGNNWTAIRGTCLGRSYCQIKDKGRRCLFLLGWETGRSKVETDSSSLHAKRIANAVLAELE